MSSPLVEPRPPAFWAALTGLGCCGGLMILVVACVIALTTLRPSPAARRSSLAAPASTVVAPVDSADSAGPGQP